MQYRRNQFSVHSLIPHYTMYSTANYLRQTKYLIIALLLFLSLFTGPASAQNDPTDSLKGLINQDRFDQEFKAADTMGLVHLWYLCAGFYRLGESDSMRKYADLGLKYTLDYKKGIKDKMLLFYLNKYEMIFYKNIGISYFDKDDYTAQTEYFQKYLAKAREIKSDSDIGTALSYIASCFRELEDYDQAFSYAQQAYAILKNTNNKSSIGSALAIYGSYYFDKKIDYDSSYYWKKKVFDTYEEIQNLPLYCGSHLDLIEIFIYFQKYDSCQKYLDAVEPFIEQLQFPEYTMTYKTYRAILDFEERHTDAAMKNLQEAMVMARETENKEDDFNIHKYLSLVLVGAEQRKEALATIDSAFNEYSDDVNLEKARSLTKAQLNFEFEKERAIAAEQQKREVQLRNFSIAIGVLLMLLVLFIFKRYRERHRYSIELKQKNDELESAINELKSTQQELVETEKQREAQQVRVRIARDIHDDIGSGLTKITLLSDITQKKTNESETREALQKITGYSKGVSASLSEIVWAIHPGNDHVGSLVSYMKSTANQLMENSGINFIGEFPLEDTQQSIHPEVKRNIYLVMKEALHNALKYSGATNVKVSFRAEKGHFFLEIADNGKGFDLPSQDDNGEYRKYGNGLINMKQRMSALGNALEVITAPGEGCTITAMGCLFPAANTTAA